MAHGWAKDQPVTREKPNKIFRVTLDLKLPFDL